MRFPRKSGRFLEQKNLTTKDFKSKTIHLFFVNMKLISFNIGIKIDNSQEIGKFITSQNPDFVAFQEIMRHFDESTFAMYKSKAHIEKIIGKKMPYSFFGPLFIAKNFTKNGKVHRDLGGFVEQGNEVISKFPIIEATNEFYYKQYSYDSDRTHFATEDHSRAVQIVEVEVHGKKLQIFNLHGAYSKDKQDSERTIAQCKYVLAAAKRKNIPTIIAGDFNLLPNTKSIRLIEKKFRNLITEHHITSTVPDHDHGTEPKKGRFVMDYIFVNDKIRVNKFGVFETAISDHLPLILDFDIIA
jgi:endonuclease/exonuclease/phosphatase family metal-dependent hydrolase